ncbi:hypothetical protein DUNSADRAFT_301 [Dunaliella salina]|uniref:Rhodanese domain-containing protein n=1 Tax=Dunaliella salina TaxID=3046 RepID=A0ABQ7GYG8_DUNSA|nr:hypothetical protein DUNSADRAFT_301 [Dunaliella salina]|eukprot:KAF5839642.1 hypothetical protein DUNSADRAFT_301 [Dunaliella salina]
MIANSLRGGLHASCLVLAPAKPSTRSNRTLLHSPAVATQASLNSNSQAQSQFGFSTPALSLPLGKKRSLRRSQNKVSQPVCLAPCCASAADIQGPVQTLGNQEGAEQQQQQQQQEYVVVNTYHLVDVPEPQAVVEEHRKYVQANKLDITGRIYISAQGLNAQFGGTVEHALQYVTWLKDQQLWQDLRFSVWPAEGPMFPKLRLKYKPNLISLAGGLADLPITDPEARATPVPPKKWKEMAAEAEAKRVVMLDVRNDYEWDAGHFRGAARPAEEEFNDTPVGDGVEGLPAPLRTADPETPVMMMCTGGIRCDIYSTLLKAKGFKNLYTLEGGIQNYLRQEGSEFWDGSLFVFDGRMAISPEEARNGTIAKGPRPAAVPCQICGSPDSEVPHVNCANIDCNELFIACAKCKRELNGCCCQECMQAPRLLRPAKFGGGNYGTWNSYTNSTSESFLSPKAREGRVARRARRRQNLKLRQQRIVQERAARKTMMKEAMAKLMNAQELPADTGRERAQGESKESVSA